MRGATYPADPIGICDSGVGGLSVLQYVQAYLPHENYIYFADSLFNPYGGKSEELVRGRLLHIVEFMQQQGVKALVVACNSATAAGIHILRERFPGLILVGVEPGLKPAALLSKSRVVGVLATERTITSSKFTRLVRSVSASSGIHILLQPCPGLVDLIEANQIGSPALFKLVKHFVRPLIDKGVDTLVLGCTHYPFASREIESACDGVPIHLVDTGDAVARRIKYLLTQAEFLNSQNQFGKIKFHSSGDLTALLRSAEYLLGNIVSRLNVVSVNN